MGIKGADQAPRGEYREAIGTSAARAQAAPGARSGCAQDL